MILWHFTLCGEFSKGLNVSYLNVHWHRTGIGSILAGGPYS